MYSVGVLPLLEPVSGGDGLDEVAGPGCLPDRLPHGMGRVPQEGAASVGSDGGPQQEPCAAVDQPPHSTGDHQQIPGQGQVTLLVSHKIGSIGTRAWF